MVVHYLNKTELFNQTIWIRRVGSDIRILNCFFSKTELLFWIGFGSLNNNRIV